MPLLVPSSFSVALICALPLEAAAATALLDTIYPPFTHLTRPTDPNTYTLGRLAGHNTVIALLPGAGKLNAALLAVDLRISFPALALALVVGVAGAVPTSPSGVPIHLGDVLVSTAVAEFDLETANPRAPMPAPPGANPALAPRALLSRFASPAAASRLRARMGPYAAQLAARPELRAAYPGPQADRLFASAYQHRHRRGCSICSSGGMCSAVMGTDCSSIGCDLGYEIRRVKGARGPGVHFGVMGCSDWVVRAGTERDGVAVREQVVGFEMEAAGVWDTLPTIVVKGVADYADSHKTKGWQAYASVTAAACARALLEEASG
ncbi:purine and uridine phosphorylase [Trichodelitschia bisporula]|uniref:Purine and uridine phosphorylase n=1 Tax=Trichodelitschia bisporula TaxID=703511 RepID=A0A6G1IAV0_9PEZI|nr:purine and uridine phosphorylase [Trichodelitschia bisporula]